MVDYAFKVLLPFDAKHSKKTKIQILVKNCCGDCLRIPEQGELCFRPKITKRKEWAYSE